MRYPYLVPLAMLVILLAASCSPYRPQDDPGVRRAAIAPPAHYYGRPREQEPLRPQTDEFVDRLLFGPHPENQPGFTIERRGNVQTAN